MFRKFLAYSMLLGYLVFFSAISMVFAEEIEWVDDTVLLEELEPIVTDPALWVPQKGDFLLVEVDSHQGYLTREDGSQSYRFPVLTGQNRMVWYLGRYYFAATPLYDFEAKALDIKEDRVTFGNSGRFLRLYKKGEATPYGIHPYKYFEENFKAGKGYVSMGCILVQEGDMDLITKTWEENGESLKVKTVGGDRI